VVAVEVVSVEVAVVVEVEVGDRQVPAGPQCLTEAPQNEGDVRHVVQRQGRVDQIEGRRGQALAGEVEQAGLEAVPVGLRAGLHAVVEHGEHAGGGVGEQHSVEPVGQRPGDLAGAAAVLKGVADVWEGHGASDRVGDAAGAGQLRGVVVPGRGGLVEVRVSHGGDCGPVLGRGATSARPVASMGHFGAERVLSTLGGRSHHN